MPRQLANRPRAHPSPSGLSRPLHARGAEYPVLPTVSRGCPGARGRLPTCYSAVRHSIRAPKGALTVRLACVRRAASVHPEPGSNSPFKCDRQGCLASFRFEPSRPVSAMSFNSDPLGQGTRREWCYTPLNLSRTCPIVCPGCRPSRAAVSGFQGSPRSRRALCPAAARGVNIRSLPPDRCGNRRVHGSYTTQPNYGALFPI